MNGAFEGEERDTLRMTQGIGGIIGVYVERSLLSDIDSIESVGIRSIFSQTILHLVYLFL